MSIQPSGDYVERQAGDFDATEWAEQEAVERFLALLDDAYGDPDPVKKQNRFTHRWFAASRWQR